MLREDARTFVREFESKLQRKNKRILYPARFSCKS